MSRVPTRRGGGGGGLTLVIIVVLMMCVSVVVGVGGYVLFKPKKTTKDDTLTDLKAKDDTLTDLKAKVDALENDDNADPAELATAQAELATTEVELATGNCVGTWGEFGDCSETCGGGIQTKEWTTTTEPLNGGTVCPSPSTETQACNEQACPVATNCVGAWSGWGACSETCGGGIQSQNYAVSTDETNGGTCTERGKTNEKPCNEQLCPIGLNGFDNETVYIKDVEDRYVGGYSQSNRKIMGHGYWYEKASYILNGSLENTTIQSAGKYCIGFDNRINCSGDSGDDRGDFRFEKQSDGGFKIYNKGLDSYLGLGDILGREFDKTKYPDEKQNMILYLERVP